MFYDESPNGPRREAIELFRRAYEAQVAEEYEAAIELYKRSLAVYPTAEAHTFLGWVYSFQERYDDAIEECLEAIRVDPTFGNPYNDIGSYLVAKGNLYDCVKWFKRALAATRYESYAFPHMNLGRVFEQRGYLLKAARHYALALKQNPHYTQAIMAMRRLQGKLN
ncbi:MAG TPA: tetratricopeptide repeat protein [Pyrinomonadaceae bacterium]